MSAEILLGDNVELMRGMADCSIDAIVTDPPAGINFMNKPFDSDKGGRDSWVAWLTGVMKEAYRVAKPGAHAVVWALPRTSGWTHRAIEDAGWEVRDCITHLFGSGFPKSHNLPDGRGTALKPGAEFWYLARKPLAGTVAQTVLAYGTGALNIDGCRIGTESTIRPMGGKQTSRTAYGTFAHDSAQRMTGGSESGRWPANVILDETAAGLLDAMSGELSKRGNVNGTRSGKAFFGSATEDFTSNNYQYSTGGASRFFLTAAIDDPDAEHLRLSPQIDNICLICNGTYTPKHSIMNGVKGDTPCESVVTANKSSNRTGKANSSATDHVPELLPLDFGDNNQSSNGHASTAALSSSNTKPTRTPIAPSSAWDSLTEQLAHRVKSAESLCDSCATAIAQRLAAMLHGQSPEQHHGWGSISEHNAQILTRCLALFVESLGSTGTTPTTASLNLWFGYVRDAMRHSTPTVETAIDPDQLRFRYVSKSSRSERNAGLDGMPERHGVNGAYLGLPDQRMDHEQARRPSANHHPTVKPLSLMRWLVRLVTPPGGVILDPFTGSGSTGCAAALEGFDFIGCEREAEYVEIARARIAHWTPKPEPQLILSLEMTA